MSEAKFTKGPWFVSSSGPTVFALHGEPQRNRFSAHVEAGRRDDADIHELLANARLMAAAPELLGVAEELGAWFGLTKPPLDQWEELAEEFHKETGFMRPGKDYPMGAGLDEEREAERSEVWKAWAEKRRAEMIARLRAAIAKATGEQS